MANTKEEYWTVGGVSLHTYAWNLAKVVEGLPGRRGSNLAVPYRTGEVWRPKILGPRLQTLSMWVTDNDQDGNLAATDQARRAQLNENLAALKAMFAPTTAQLALTKRVRRQSGLLTLTGSGECTDAFQFEATDEFAEISTFAVSLTMADPYWYGSQINGSTFTNNHTLNHPGDAWSESMVIRLSGPLTDPQVTNQTTSAFVKWTGTIGAGAYVDLDVGEYTALTNTGANVIGSVTHGNAHPWLNLAPGNNSLLLTKAAGTGTAQITFKPPYL